MRVMVVGGAGFVGSHLVERLLAAGHGVDVVDDLSTGSLANLAAARAMGGDTSIHTLDVVAPEFPELVARRAPEVIFHLAWDRDRFDAESTGWALRSTIDVLDAADRVDAKVVVAVPAAALYGEVPTREQPVKEGRPWAPVGLRGLVIQAICGVLGLYRTERAVEYTVLALSSVYGPRQRPESGVVAAFAHAAANGQVPVIHGDGRQARDFLYIDDAVDALARTVDRGDGLVINIGTGHATPVRDLWQMIAPTNETTPRVDATRRSGVSRFVVSSTRARIHLAWESWTDLSTGIAELA